MESLRKEINNALSSDAELLGSFEQYCNVFFNRRSKDNNCILLGVKKQELFTEMFGFSYPVLINDTVHYLIRIKSSQSYVVQVTFKAKSNGYTDEEQLWFRNLYSYYNADQNVNLSLFFAKKQSIPPLTISGDWAREFLDNPNENFRFLDGEKLIEKVSICYPKVIDVNLFKSLDDVFIIPEKYSMFAEYKKSIQQDVEPKKQGSDDFLELFIRLFASDDNNRNKKADFWKSFSEKVCSVDKVNFVILNHNDDFMVLAFFDLIEQLRKKYANINLLKRIFFVYDESAKKTKAATSKELPEASKKLFQELSQSLRAIETTQCDCALYVCALEYLESFDAKIKQKADKTISEIKKLLFKALKNNLLK